MKYLLLILLPFMSILAFESKELIKDPKFKKPTKHWLLGKTKEYEKCQEDYKRDSFSVETEQTSNYFYLILFTELNLEVGKTYLFTCEAKSPGEGHVIYEYGSYNDVFNKSKKKTHKKGKPINLGMKEKVAAPGDEWQTIQVEFIVKAKAPSDKKSFLKVHLGEYLGKYQIRKASLKQIKLM